MTNANFPLPDIHFEIGLTQLKLADSLKNSQVILYNTRTRHQYFRRNHILIHAFPVKLRTIILNCTLNDFAAERNCNSILEHGNFKGIS